MFGGFLSNLREKSESEKSTLFCSKNVSHNVASDLARIVGSFLVADLGMYLGVPLIHSRFSKNTYQYVLYKMNKRLACWKGQHLSLAGKSVLIKSVLSSLPVYSMNIVKLLKSICNKMDKISRNFLWSGPSDQKKIHLVK